MYRTRAKSFADPELYQAAVHPARWEVLVTKRGDFRADLTQIEMPRIFLQRSREWLPRVVSSVVSTERPPICFLADADQQAMRHSGADLSFGELMVVGAGSEHHHRTEAPSHWATLSMTRDDLATAGRALLGHDLTFPSETYVLRPSPPRLARLMNLHLSAAQFAKRAAYAPAQSVYAMEQAILHALVTCLTEGIPPETSSKSAAPPSDHRAIGNNFGG